MAYEKEPDVQESISRKVLDEILRKNPPLKPVPQPFRAFLLPAYRTKRPKKFERSTPRMDRRLRPWQLAAFRALCCKMLRILIAPTGSGKTTPMIALALNDVAKGFKVIVSYPMHDIAPGFDPMRIWVPGGKRESWAPRKLDDEATDKVQEIIDFLRSPPSESPHLRTLICTHAALVYAHKRLANVPGGNDLWKGTSLFIDEGHHSGFEEPDEINKNEWMMNGLAKIIAMYAHQNTAPLTVVTATWMRTKDKIILPGIFPMFACFEHPIEKYLASLKHLREIKIRFIVGAQLDSLDALIKAEPKRKTIVYQPGGHDPETKMDILGECKNVARRYIPEEKIADAVTVAGRPQRMKNLFTAIKAQGAANEVGIPPSRMPNETPDIIFTLNKLCEGADWQEASRAILLAPRGSIQVTLQILGRILRDWPGKKCVHLDIVIPIDVSEDAEKPTPGQIMAYLKIILASMVIDWQFRKQDVLKFIPKGSKGERLRALVGDIEESKKLLDKLLNKAVLCDGDPAMYDQNIEEILRKIFKDKEPADPDGGGGCGPVKKIITDTFKRVQKLLHDADDIDYTPEMREVLDDEENPYGVVQYLSILLTQGSMLQDIRKSLGKRPPLSLEQIDNGLRAYNRRTKEWPTTYTKTISEFEGLSGSVIEHRLVRMFKSSLNKRCQILGKSALASLTLKQIDAGLCAYNQRTKEWPLLNSKAIPELEGLSGSAINQRLIKKFKSNLNKRCQIFGKPTPVSFTLKQIDAGLRAYNRRTKEWPTQHSRAIPELEGLSGRAIEYRLIKKFKSNLNKRCQIFGKPTPVSFTLKQINAGLRTYNRRTKEWPLLNFKAIPELEGLSGRTINQRLIKKFKSNLNKRCQILGKPTLVSFTLKQIDAGLRAYNRRTKEWPTQYSKAIPELEGLSGNAINCRLKKIAKISLSKRRHILEKTK